MKRILQLFIPASSSSNDQYKMQSTHEILWSDTGLTDMAERIGLMFDPCFKRNMTDIHRHAKGVRVNR